MKNAIKCRPPLIWRVRLLLNYENDVKNQIKIQITLREIGNTEKSILLYTK